MSGYKDILNECSKELIIYDGVTLANAILDNRDDIFSLSIIPFLALYCRSTEEYLNKDILKVKLDREISDIRNGLKAFTGRFSKSKKISAKSDENQDDMFREMLRFSFLKRFNIHDNLGIYYNKENKIVGNTQYANFYIEMSERKNTNAYKIGKRLGKALMSILTGELGIPNPRIEGINYGSIPEYGYIDYNTNRMGEYFKTSLNKEENLILLHLATTISFVNNFIFQIFDYKNLWAFRILYITVHNLHIALQKFVSHVEQNEEISMEMTSIRNGLLTGKKVISSDFRGCMMHYSFINKDKIVLKEEHFNKGLPFFGLIESSFEGEDYFSYYTKLRNYSEFLENLLISFFNIKPEKIKWD